MCLCLCVCLCVCCKGWGAGNKVGFYRGAFDLYSITSFLPCALPPPAHLTCFLFAPHWCDGRTPPAHAGTLTRRHPVRGTEGVWVVSRRGDGEIRGTEAEGRGMKGGAEGAGLGGNGRDRGR